MFQATQANITIEIIFYFIGVMIFKNYSDGTIRRKCFSNGFQDIRLIPFNINLDDPS
jgi:hypothetical protein